MKAAQVAADATLDPRDVLGIGVTGHRLDRLGVERVAGVRAAIDSTLAAIEAAAVGVVPGVALRLITCLADGVDMTASGVALARKWPVDTILPFARSEYARDFNDPAMLADYESLLASSRSVFELPGERHPDGDGTAYERAGRVTLSQSDLLLAVWDGELPRGRGGTGHVIAEAVLQGLPVILIHPDVDRPIEIVWDGLTDHDLGQQSIESVARGDMSALPRLMGSLLARPEADADRRAIDAFALPLRTRGTLAIAYPLLQAIVGVRPLRRSDFGAPDQVAARKAIATTIGAASRHGADFADRLAMLAARFARADTAGVMAARVFRSSYVANFLLSALAVILSLSGLLLPAMFKPALVSLEFLAIASILLITREGNRLDWHRRWLDHRELAERLRCLALSAQLGDLNLRAGDISGLSWVNWFARATGREIGLPSVSANAAYLEDARNALRHLLDEQIAYLRANAHSMHVLEHRLHRLGTALFMTTAAVCVTLLLIVGIDGGLLATTDPIGKLLIKLAIVISAALPAMGSAIYAIRMQGDFGGVGARSAALATQLGALRHVVDEDKLCFDTLKRRTARATELLTTDLTDWGQAFRARPLTLPG